MAQAINLGPAPSQPYVIEGGLTIPQVAEALKLSPTTIRRYIRQGRIQAQLTPGKFGPEYTITHIPDELLPQAPSKLIGQTLGYQSLMAEIARLNKENSAQLC